MMLYSWLFLFTHTQACSCYVRATPTMYASIAVGLRLCISFGSCVCPCIHTHTRARAHTHKVSRFAVAATSAPTATVKRNNVCYVQISITVAVVVHVLFRRRRLFFMCGVRGCCTDIYIQEDIVYMILFHLLDSFLFSFTSKCWSNTLFCISFCQPMWYFLFL